jgi:hypothetical protein
MSEPIFMKLGTDIMALEAISTAYFINPSHQSVSLYAYPLFGARQRFNRNINSAKNTHAKYELLEELFSIRSVPYQKKASH